MNARIAPLAVLALLLACDASPEPEGKTCDETGLLYVDADGDGYGDNATEADACDAPTGAIEQGGDCDDTDPTLSLPLTWYADEDLDGYGDDSAPVEACTAPEGYVAQSGDCDPSSADVHPGAPEEDCADPVDYNCDGSVGYADEDGDGYAACEDCDDDRASAYPGAAERWYDGHDDDCLGDSDYDQDGDGYDTRGYGGTDCDDQDASVYPGAEDSWYDGVDGNCDGASDYDADGDGHIIDSRTGGDDCDDTDADVHPGAGDTWYDGSDGDCDGASDYDADGDGRDSIDYGGDDCDDAEATVAPGLDETWYDGVDSDCDGASDYDADGDGHEHVDWDGGDCDDTDALVNPDGTETCDGVDNDCNGVIDDAEDLDLLTWYYDGDGDGFGVPTDWVDACDAPRGYAEVDTDCDDGSSDAYPGSTELCDGVDNDCDGETDEADAADALAWYTDLDADGYGDDATSYTACEAGSGDIALGGDCDDEDEDVSPDQTEICGDGIDNDCDDSAGDCALSGTIEAADADAIYGGEASSDYVGLFVTTAGDVNGDGLDDLLIGAPYHDEVGSDSGVVYVVYGGSTGSVDLGDAEAMLIGENRADEAGYWVSGGGDANGDGTPDLFVGAPVNSAGGSGAGAAYVVMGPVSGDLELSSADGKLVGEDRNDYAGQSVAFVGDVDDDGNEDMLVGAYFSSDGGSYSGTAYLALGPSTGTVDLSSAFATFIGESAGDRAGWMVSAAGDVDSDGYSDMLIAAPYHSGGAYRAGAVYLQLGPTAGGSMDLSTADTILSGSSYDDHIFVVLSEAGDTDEDGYDDILISAEGHDDGGSDAGAAFLVLGPVSSDIDMDSADAQLVGEAAGDMAGVSVSGAGDVDGDGVPDLMVGASKNDEGGTDAGAAYVVLSPVSGTVDLSDADIKLVGGGSSEYAGYCATSAGDVDGDSTVDLVMGAPEADAGASGGGAVYLFLNGSL